MAKGKEALKKWTEPMFDSEANFQPIFDLIVRLENKFGCQWVKDIP